MQPSEEQGSEQTVAQVVEQELAEESDEEQSIRRWRFDQFVRLGYDYVMAALLADSRADLNQVRTMIGVGCPLETASRIVL